MDLVVTKFRGSDYQLLWSTYLGNSGFDQPFDVTVDATGNVVGVGRTQDSAFPTTSGAFQETIGHGSTINGRYDGFVFKLSSDGSTLLWSTFLGGNGSDQAHAVALDFLGNVVVTGGTIAVPGTAFPTTPGAYDETWNGSYDVFVSKLSASGSSLLWSTLIGGINSEVGTGITLDQYDNPIIIGSTSGTATDSLYPTTVEAYSHTHTEAIPNNSIVTKLNSTGSGLLYSSYLPGNLDGLALNSDENLLVAGSANAGFFPTTAGAYDESHNGQYDGVAALFDISEPPVAVLVSIFSARWIENSIEVIWSLSSDSDDLDFEVWRKSGQTPFKKMSGLEFTRSRNEFSFEDADIVPGTDYSYRVVILEDSKPAAQFEVDVATPHVQLTLHQNVPNPFNPDTHIKFGVDQAQHVRLQVYDIAGHLVRSLVDAFKEPGIYVETWDGRNHAGKQVASGVYFYRLEVGKQMLTRKATLMR